MTLSLEMGMQAINIGLLFSMFLPTNNGDWRLPRSLCWIRKGCSLDNWPLIFVSFHICYGQVTWNPGNDLLSMGCGHPATTLRFYHSNFLCSLSLLMVVFAHPPWRSQPFSWHWHATGWPPLFLLLRTHGFTLFHPWKTYPVRPYLTPCFKDNGP